MEPRARDLAALSVASLRPEDTASFALGFLVNLGIHAAPVLDAEGRVLGLLSRSDLCGPIEDDYVRDRMHAPVTAVDADLDVPALVRAFAESHHHHMPVVDAEMRLVGMVSSIDVLRALSGMPVEHPAVFDCHRDCQCWSDAAWLTPQAPDFVPEEPGVIVIFDPDDHDRLVWAGKTLDRRETLRDLLRAPPEDLALRQVGGPLRFRHARRGPH